MISVLIPTYNYNVLPLATALHNQCEDVGIAFEIIALDDASTDETFQKDNDKINTLPYGRFEVMETNLGRSKIRNLLATKAKYGWLLFLDADTFPANPDFISKYVTAISEETAVIFGGISYPEKTAEHFSLRHKYGMQRESLPLEKRLKNLYRSFITMGFAIKKEVFEKIKFNEQLAGYGYEDSVFAFQLKAEHIPILHIDNPVIHLNLESNEAFINKSQLALQNLLNFYQKGHISANSVKILEKYLQLKKYGGLFIIRGFFKLFKKTLLQNLNSPKPSLFLFDLYRLGYLSTLNGKNA